MTQTSLDLRTAGYREPSVESFSYPYLPVPNDPVEWERLINFLTGTSNNLGGITRG